MKSGIEFSSLKISELLQSCSCQVQKISPERLIWPCRLAGTSKGAYWFSKQKILTHCSASFLSKQINSKTRDFSVLKYRTSISCQELLFSHFCEFVNLRLTSKNLTMKLLFVRYGIPVFWFGQSYDACATAMHIVAISVWMRTKVTDHGGSRIRSVFTVTHATVFS